MDVIFILYCFCIFIKNNASAAQLQRADGSEIVQSATEHIKTAASELDGGQIFGIVFGVTVIFILIQVFLVLMYIRYKRRRNALMSETEQTLTKSAPIKSHPIPIGPQYPQYGFPNNSFSNQQQQQQHQQEYYPSYDQAYQAYPVQQAPDRTKSVYKTFHQILNMLA